MGSTYFTHESASARLSQLDHPRAYLLTNVFAMERGRGHATGLMKIITEFADAHRSAIFLDACPYGRPINTALNTLQLVKFYENHGFVVQDRRRIRGIPMFREAVSQDLQLS